MFKALARRLLRRLERRASFQQLVARLAETHPVLGSPQMRFAPPGHYSSPLPDPNAIERDVARLYGLPSSDDGVQLNSDAQRRLLTELAAYAASFPWGEQPTPGLRFWLKNGLFEHGDAAVLFAMIRHWAPRRIIEVGSGFSSALMLDANERFCYPPMELWFIEPYPERLEKLLSPRDRATTRLLTTPVQSVPVAEFDALGPNDILFIDSSHVSKIGSDVNFLLFTVLPRLRRGVLVHFHDIFYPFEYPLAWAREGRAWNELYLLRAFLQYNAAFEIVFFNSYLAQEFPEDVGTHLPLMKINPGGSIWLRRIK